MQDGYTPQALGARTREAISARGARPVFGDLARWGTGAVTGLPWSVPGSRGGFELHGRWYPYLYHRYKLSWLTERAIEVPVVQAVVDAAGSGAQVLEVGHVLGHYREQTHTVVDKYEQAPGVLNLDVIELGDAGLGKFDLIVAISTLEHVGWDEPTRDPAKALQAVQTLRAMLAPGGRLVLTVPVGYNPWFDGALRGGSVPLRCSAALRRDRGSTRWREVQPAKVWSAPYDFLRYAARGVLLAVIDAAPG